MKEGTMKRLLKMLWSKYKIHLVIVFQIGRAHV